MIKEIGIRARQDIENYLGKQVYLDLYVRTLPKWRDKEKYLSELGFKSE
jgi:GTP-binding protein Era